MKLLIDIGNTKCSMAFAEGERIHGKYFIHTDKKKVQPVSLKRLLGQDLRKTDDIVIVSVVPKFLTVVRKSLKAIAPSARVRVVGREIKVPMKIKYRAPGEVGQDRLVTAFAAAGRAQLPLVVVDFGTAVTFDLIGAKGDYEGGLIFPGLRLALGSLEKNTALLPHIELKAIKGLIGKDTRGSMNKGIVLGYASMCDGLIQKFRKKYGNRLDVIATGGDAALISKYSTRIKKVIPDLIFSGLSKLSS